MSLRWKDGMVTLFVAGATALYALWATGTALGGLSTRAVGWIVFGLGWAGCVSNQSEVAVVYGVDGRRRPPLPYVVIASSIGAVALLAAVLTLVRASEIILATLVASMIALWAMSTVRHGLRGQTRTSQNQQAPMARAA
jgi:hypothetical protein